MSFEGQIGEIDLVQRLVELGRERFTGAIRFEQDGIIKIVYFKEGDVLSASTNDRKDAVDEILLRSGKVGKEHVKQALARRKETETLGDALLSLGFITRKELTWARRVQVIGILRSVRSWTNGAYAIVADYLPKREEGTFFPLPQIIVELFVTEPERQPFERALDGGSAVLARSEGFDEAFQRIGLNEEAAEIVSKIDGSKTASEIAGAAGKDTFNTYKLLEALRALGLLRKLEAKVEVKDELGFESIGVADAADAWKSGRIPAFHLEPEPPVEPVTEAAPPPPAVSIPKPEEVKWGFDEAQIETAQRSTAPSPAPPAPAPRRVAPKVTRSEPKKTSRAPVFALVVILLLGAAAFGGWYYLKQTTVKPVPITPVEKKPVAPAIPVPVAAPPPPTTATVATTPAPTRVATAEKFTIQVELVCQQASLKKAQDAGGAKIWFIPISYRGQSCFRVFWGRYDRRAAAEAAVGQIPPALRGSKPVVVSIPQP
jgi:septal ring-binding cell division protein DamX